MKSSRPLFRVLTLTLLLGGNDQIPAQSSAFTYQGRLTANGAASTGSAEFQFTLWDAASGDSAVATNNPASVIADVKDSKIFALEKRLAELEKVVSSLTAQTESSPR